MKRRISCAYADREGRRRSSLPPPSPLQSSTPDGRSSHRVTSSSDRGHVPSSTGEDSFELTTSIDDSILDNHGNDNEQQSLSTDPIVVEDAGWTDASSIKDRTVVIAAVPDRGSLNGDETITPSERYDFHAMDSTQGHQPVTAGSLDSLSSLPPYGVQTPAPPSASVSASAVAVAEYRALYQFTGYPGIPVESPTTRWLDLLVHDATIQNGPLPDWEYDSNGLDVFGNSVAQSPMSVPNAAAASLSVPLKPVDDGPSLARQRHPFSASSTTSAYLTERIPHVGNQKREEVAWKAVESIELRPHETILLRHYAEHISRWVSLLITVRKSLLTITDGPIRSSTSLWNICSTSGGNNPSLYGL